MIELLGGEADVGADEAEGRAVRLKTFQLMGVRALEQGGRDAAMGSGHTGSAGRSAAAGGPAARERHAIAHFLLQHRTEIGAAGATFLVFLFLVFLIFGASILSS